MSFYPNAKLLTRLEIFLTTLIISCGAQNGGFSVSSEAKMIYDYGLEKFFLQSSLLKIFIFSKLASGILRIGALSRLLDTSSKGKPNLRIGRTATARLLDMHGRLALERLLPQVGRDCCSDALILHFQIPILMFEYFE